MKEYINFCGTLCEVMKRYTLTEEQMAEFDLYNKNRITFMTKNGEIDCADTFDPIKIEKYMLIRIEDMEAGHQVEAELFDSLSSARNEMQRQLEENYDFYEVNLKTDTFMELYFDSGYVTFVIKEL